MAEMPPRTLSRHLTELIGRKVAFAPTKSATATKDRQVYGIYTIHPTESVIVVKADLSLLGSCAGALLGFPDAEVRKHLQSNPLEEVMRDAIYEVLNVTSAVIATEGRAVLTGMLSETDAMPAAAASVLAKPTHVSHFKVSVQGYAGGTFTVLTDDPISDEAKTEDQNTEGQTNGDAKGGAAMTSDAPSDATSDQAAGKASQIGEPEAVSNETAGTPAARGTVMPGPASDLVPSTEAAAWERAGSRTGFEDRARDTPVVLGPADEAANLKVVMDVELSVTLRFGQRLLSLREVLDLSSGSVIELDRQVDDPVELLLDGRVIARGEAVVIDGCYGIRVTEVPRLNQQETPRGSRSGVNSVNDEIKKDK